MSPPEPINIGDGVTYHPTENILNLQGIIKKRLATSRYRKLAKAVEQIGTPHGTPINRTSRASRCNA